MLSPSEDQREASENSALSINNPVRLTGTVESISHKRAGEVRKGQVPCRASV